MLRNKAPSLRKAMTESIQPYSLARNRKPFQAASKNTTFLREYLPYIVRQWRSHYFAYDGMKSIYLIAKESGDQDLVHEFEQYLYDEIERVATFLDSKLQTLESDLSRLKTANHVDPNKFIEGGSQTKSKEHILSRAHETGVRKCFHFAKDCEEYHSLNHYAILKIGKKYEKLLAPNCGSGFDGEVEETAAADFACWKKLPSFKYFSYDFLRKMERIAALRKEALAVYCNTYRKTYPALAMGELKFGKHFTGDSKDMLLSIGMKLGAILTMVLWLIWASYTINNGLLSFWNEPALYIYTSIGNLLLFRALWICSIYVWDKFEVNYITIFGVKHNSPNVLIMVDEITTVFVLYAISFVLFFWSNSDQIKDGRNIASGLAPMFLLCTYIVYQSYQLYRFAIGDLSHGLYDKKVMWHLLRAPFTDPDFRDVFAADCLCSMTRIITDSLYGACWLITGNFLNSSNGFESSTEFGNSNLNCTGNNMYVLATCAQIIPMLLRATQCYKKGPGFWYRLNMTKYIFVIILVLFDAFRDKTNEKAAGIYYALRVIAVLFLWFWDTHRDWGFLEQEISLYSAPIEETRESKAAAAAAVTAGAIAAAARAAASTSTSSTYGRSGTAPDQDLPHPPMPSFATATAGTDGDEDNRSEVSRFSLEGSVKVDSVADSCNSNNYEGSFSQRNHATGRSRRGTSMGFTPHIKHHRFLRTYLMYPYTWQYYLAIVMNFIFRSLWVLSLSVDSAGLVGSQLNFFLATMELIRRCIWGFIRIEKEHLRLESINAPGFRNLRPAELRKFARQQSSKSGFAASIISKRHHHHHRSNNNNNNGHRGRSLSAVTSTAASATAPTATEDNIDADTSASLEEGIILRERSRSLSVDIAMGLQLDEAESENNNNNNKLDSRDDDNDSESDSDSSRSDIGYATNEGNSGMH